MTEAETKRLEEIAKDAERRNLLTGEAFPEWSEFLALLERIKTLEKAATYASAELRHALSYRKPDGCIDTNLVSRAVVTLEAATTPNRPESKP